MNILFEKFELFVLEDSQQLTNFKLKPIIGSRLSLANERRKVYIIKDQDQFLYVGEANTSIKTRFQRSFISHRYFLKNKKARGGYKGYKWIGEYLKKVDHALHVYVAIFDKIYDQDREFLEAVEGELVFLIKQNSDSWPLYQNEIHFSNRENAKEIALDIFNKISSS